MKPVLPPALCPDCGQPSVLVPRTAVFRRDTRQVTVEGWFWECPSNCPDEEGRRPARFSTPALMEWEEAQARLRWLELFGQAMPSGKPPRPAVSLAPSDLSWIDAHRGDRSREHFLHDLIREHRKAS